MNISAEIKRVLLALLAVSLVSACGGGDSNEPVATTTPPAPVGNGGIAITGAASKGPMQMSNVDLIPINASGEITGPAIINTTTDANGVFTATVPAGTGPLLIRVGGGSYVDEADRVDPDEPKRRIDLADDEGLESLLPQGVTTVAVSVVTQALLDKTRREAPPGLFLEQFEANRDVFASAFGFDVVTTLPANPVSPAAGSTQLQRQYAMVLGGVANLINRITVDAGFTEPTIETILAASDDLSDGRIDGLIAGAPVLVACVGIRAFSLNEEIARFYNNNFNTYSATPLIIVNETVLAQSVPVSPACDLGSGPELVKSYDFDGGLSDTLGNGADLTASGGSIDAGRYVFGLNEGLRLTNALPCTTDYAIEIRFQVNDSVAGFNKLIDFGDLESDLGLYVLDGTINFFDYNPSGGNVMLNTDTTVGLVRSAGQMDVYQDGFLLFSVADGTAQAVSPANILNFFVDDLLTGQGEAFAGSVDFIRIHRDASTFSTLAPGTLTLNGNVSLAAMASASVVATVDSSATGGGIATFPTTAGANGDYSVTIDVSGPDDFVSLTATGAVANDNDDLIFRSLVGSSQTLVAAGGDDDTVDSSELRAVDISHLSTVAAVLAEERNGGTPASDVELAEALAAVDSSALIRFASALQAIIENEQIQIGSDTTTIAVLSDENFRNEIATMIQSSFPDEYDLATEQTATEFRAPYAANEVPSTLYFTAHGNLSFRPGQRFIFNPDGSGTFIDGFNGSTATTWSIDANGDIRVVFDTPFENTDFPFIGNEQVEQVTTFDRVVIQRFLQGTRADHVFARDHRVLTYPQNPEIPTEEVDAAAGTSTARLAVAQTISFEAADLAGQGVTATFYHQQNASVGDNFAERGFDTLDFNTDGSGSSRRRQFQFTWAVAADGSLNVVFANGDENNFVGLLPEDDGVLNAILHATPANGEPAFVQRSLLVTRDETQAFDEPSLENRRFRSFAATGGTIFPEFNLGAFDFQFSPLGVACRNPGSGSTDWSWSAVNGRVEIERRVIADNSLRAHRTWQPLRLVDNRFWVIETLEINTGNLTNADITPGRTAVYSLEQQLAGNNRPTAGNDSFFVDAGVTVYLLNSELFANDFDPEGDELVLAGNDFSSANGGTIALIQNSGGATVGLSYTPPPGFGGIDTFEYSVTDLICDPDAAPATATVTLDVAASGNTYIVNRAIGSAGLVEGTITTNGAIGELQRADILGFNLTVSDGIDQFALSSDAGAILTIINAGLFSATANELRVDFDFAGGGIVDFQDPSGPNAWTLSASGGSEQIVHNASPGVVHNQFDFSLTGIVVVAMGAPP